VICMCHFDLKYRRMSIGECELNRVDHLLFALYRADEDFASSSFNLFTSSNLPATPLKVL
jgi:hypothetical protein